MAILRGTEKTMMRAMCKVRVIEKRTSQKLMSLLSLKDTLDGLARASQVQWYGHVLRSNNGDLLRRPLDFEVAEKKRAWATKYDEEETSRGAYQSDWTEKGGCH